nr:hypothetical protein [Tanacetum cinerariifolium]
METMNVSFDELSTMAFKQRSSKPGLQCELDLLFEAMYDDYFGGQPSASVENVSPAQEPQVRQTSTASTTIANNIPIPTNSSSHATIIPITSQDVNELNSNAMVDGNTFVNPFATSSSNAAETSSLQNVDPSNMHTFYQPYPHKFQWTKDHPLEQVLGEPSRPVLTRNQLRSDGDMCIYALTVSTMELKNVKEVTRNQLRSDGDMCIYALTVSTMELKNVKEVTRNQLRSDGDMCIYALTVSTMELKNVKEAMTDPTWIESMQEELLQFKRMDVWV